MTPAGSPLASVIICTRDRAGSLRETLRALSAVRVDLPGPVELLIVDNGSRDDTAAVAREVPVPGWEQRLLHEPTPGQARARNTALAAARGRILLFLDDDVRPTPDWLAGMCRPIFDGRAEAVAGGVRIPAALDRPWMTRLHRAWLAATDFLDPVAPEEMVGANMAFARAVLARVPGFDPELGPGGFYGQADDSLFAWQLRRAGFRIAPAFDAVVEHHFDPGRLARASFRRAAAHRGRTLAYVAHHWRHERLSFPRLRAARTALRLVRRYLARSDLRPVPEGMPEWEMTLRERIAFLLRWPRERRRPRNYERFGLQRIRA